MRTAPRDLGILLAAVLICALGLPAWAAIYSSSCDRVEIDGNSFGSPGGALDFVDDFNDGTLAPNWTILLGTAQEAGTNVTIHNPGFQTPLGNTNFEISTIENAAHEIENGAGDFTASATWSSGLPGTDAEFHLQLYSISPVIEAAGLSVNNFSAQVASQQGAPVGYSITRSLTHGFGGSFMTLQSNSVAITPSSVTGPIVIRMALDDATDMLTCSFSLDGGTTFQSPFPPIHVFNDGVSDYDILVGTAGLTPNGPPPPPADQMLPLKVLSVKNPSGPTSRRITYKAKSFPHTFNYSIGDPRFGGATLNLKLDSQTQCFHMPPGNWKLGGSSFRYVDSFGANGPITTAQIKRNGSGGVQNKVTINGRNGAISIVPPGSVGYGNFHVAGGSSYCTTTAGGVIKPNDTRTFKAKNSGAPALCYVPACSPSGAFVDGSADGF
jgi:hypothetical protein